MVEKLRQNRLLLNATNIRFFPKSHRYIACVLYIGVLLIPCFSTQASNEGMALIPNGYYTPLFKDENGPVTIEVDSFYMDQYHVTNKQFNAFIEKIQNGIERKLNPFLVTAIILNISQKKRWRI